MNTGEERVEQMKRNGTIHPNPEKVRTELVTQSPFFDANDLVQMKYEMLRIVSVEQQPAAVAARMFGLSRVAYYHARSQYENHGLAGLLPHRRGPKGPHKLNDEVMAFLSEQLAAISGPPDWEFLSEQIKVRFGINIHPRSAKRAMKLKKNSKQ